MTKNKLNKNKKAKTITKKTNKLLRSGSNSTKKAANRKKMLVFAIKFFAIFIVLNFLIELVDLSFLTNAITQIAATILGLDYLLNVVYVNNGLFIVSNLCTGLVSASILAAIIFSLNKPELSKKTTLFLAGLIILLAVNIPRIIFVLFVAKYGFDAELVHELTWFVMSGLVLLIWYYGSKRLLKLKEISELL
ncbi:MAG: archaeosortase/exosortase family protein [archaeon]|jgi:exosortase/archaeosortase family protein